ncbi:MAG TPA: PucR family transcriptional regulator ligand-binding domain-containing protein [Conexibacter sp.]|nr:PucR family transcriptional regulator ligand-binding domain-containing protein [Conexibacter sp.]
MATTGMLTLGQLLDEDALGLRLLVGTDADRERVVVGAHAIDVPEPAAWVDRDWLVLTAGTELQRDPTAVDGLVRELVETQVTALAFGLEPVFDHVPERLLDAAREHGLPLVVVPSHTPFREIIERVVRASLSEDVRASQRLVAMQRYLMDALGDDAPQRTAIERLAALVQGEVGLLTREGHVDIATGPIPAAELWAAIATRPRTTLDLDRAGEPWVAVPVLTREGELLRWLVACAAQAGSTALAKAAVQAAVPLLTAIDRLDATRRRQERAIRSVVLQRLVDGDADATVYAQLEELGFVPEQPATALVVAGAAGGAGAVGAAGARGAAGSVPLLDAIESALGHSGLPFVAALRRERVVAIVQGSEPSVAALAASAGSEAVVTGVGIGGAHRLRSGVERTYREAELAVEHAGDARGGAEARPVVVAFAQLGTTTAVLAEVPLAPIRDRAEPLFERLARQPAALETLEAYFAHDLNVSTTASHLHLHPNSLRYRLSRIEEAIGAPLREPAVIAAVFLALRARSGA